MFQLSWKKLDFKGTEQVMKKSYGFTLIELIVTLAAAIVILAVGIPVFSTMIANNRAAADSNALVTALHSSAARGRPRARTRCTSSISGWSANPPTRS